MNRKHLVVGLACALVAGVVQASSIYHSDPPASLSFPDAQTALLHKDLGAFWNYGAGGGAVDILYDGESDGWNFDLSAVPATYLGSAKLRLSLVLADHYQFPATDYVGRIRVNGQPVYAGSFDDLGVEHGQPFGGHFDNWVQVELPVAGLSPAGNLVEIYNDTNTGVGSWIAIDYLELVLSAEIAVTLDVKPGSEANPVNPRSKGTIPVAVLATANLDAATIDPATSRFGVTGTETAPAQSALEDVNGDGRADLVLHFATAASGIACGSSSVVFTARTYAGQHLRGVDAISTPGCR